MHTHTHPLPKHDTETQSEQTLWKDDAGRLVQCQAATNLQFVTHSISKVQ